MKLILGIVYLKTTLELLGWSLGFTVGGVLTIFMNYKFFQPGSWPDWDSRTKEDRMLIRARYRCLHMVGAVFIFGGISALLDALGVITK
jgi:hypothetical protein